MGSVLYRLETTPDRATCDSIIRVSPKRQLAILSPRFEPKPIHAVCAI